MSGESDSEIPSDPELEAVHPDDSQRLRVAALRSLDPAMAEVLERLGRIEAAQSRAQRREDRRAGGSVVWRTLGGVAASAALALGGVALGYARDASADHVAVVAHEQRIDAAETEARDQERRVTEALSGLRESAAETKAMVSAIGARVERIDAALSRDGGRR